MSDLEQQIRECAFYKAESIKALCLIAEQIKSIKDKAERDRLSLIFKNTTGRTVSVWARVPERFPDYFGNGGVVLAADGWMALTFMAQLPHDECLDIFCAHQDHLDEPNVHLLVLQDVNAAKPKRGKKESLASVVASAEPAIRAAFVHFDTENLQPFGAQMYGLIIEIENNPAVKKELEKYREKA